MLSDLLVCRGSLSNIKNSKFLFWFSLGFLLIYNKLSKSTMSSNSDHLIASHSSAGQEFWQATGPQPSWWCPRSWKVHGAPSSCAQSLRSRASGPRDDQNRPPVVTPLRPQFSELCGDLFVRSLQQGRQAFHLETPRSQNRDFP